MKLKHVLIQPKTFIPEARYLSLEQTASPYALPGPFVLSPVEFIAYDVCPALVIVRNGDGKRYRCPRQQLYMLQDSI